MIPPHGLALVGRVEGIVIQVLEHNPGENQRGCGTEIKFTMLVRFQEVLALP